MPDKVIAYETGDSLVKVLVPSAPPAGVSGDSWIAQLMNRSLQGVPHRRIVLASQLPADRAKRDEWRFDADGIRILDAAAAVLATLPVWDE